MLNQSTPLDQGPIIFGLQIKTLIPPMVGSFFGVILAFAVNYAYQSHINHKDKIKYKNIIRSEIELCIAALEQDRVQLLPVDRWASAVNSGALSLFEVEVELESLSINYYKIKNYNNMSMKYAGHLWETLNKDLDGGHHFSYLQVKQVLERRDELLKELTKLRDSKWLNST